ncbi:MobF family relaxase [Mycolicibacterium mucogenicum]|uniref:MobF family relaxase n=1 Tax=Mycolicibacterium mucogenicum TaxID=56689 RepID=UPI000A5586DA|nr:MobF family relaxase [Mycolicibacterium mucogenicum]
MTVSMHKISAGDGYLYLVRSVAASDATHRGRSTLSDYYSVKGEAPGKWMGSGLAALSDPSIGLAMSEHTIAETWSVPEGSEVREDQMKALFGEGLHPNAAKITKYLTARGTGTGPAHKATKLGSKFKIYEDPPFIKALAQAYQDHSMAAGHSPFTKLDPDTKATVKTELARAWFVDEYGRAPADDRELSGYMARVTRPAKVAVAAYDLACSPVKSFSAMWAIAPLPVAQALEDCHQAAVADVLAEIERSVALTRTGANGAAQVDTEGVIATAFTHRDSRAGDPDLHTHLVISAKVSTIDVNGVRRWLALDGQPLHHMMVSLSELYNTRLEHYTTQNLGWVFAEAEAPGRGKRPVREIVGVPTDLLKMWSTRRAAIEARTAELAKEFQHNHGREPTALELVALSQQATLDTREAKHEPMSLAEHRAKWRTQAVELLGHRGLASMLREVDAARPEQLATVDEAWVRDAAESVLAVVTHHRARWQRHHVLAEAQRFVRTRGYAATSPADLVERITDTALSEPFSIAHARVRDTDLGEPELLRRRDGTSVYHRHGSDQYTSQAMWAAEQRIIAAVRTTGCRRAAQTDIDLALADSAARGKPLNAGQQALLQEMAAGERTVMLALAPAGSGKTTAMAALSHAWRSSGGNVIGLAPNAVAAIELSSDLNAPTDTVAKYVHTAAGGPGGVPDWFHKINAKTMIIIDEVGKAGTMDLDAVIAHALAKGACVRLVGDDGQLASVSAGGVLRDIAAETDALTLSELVRFRSESEAAATLALRAGDPAALGFYIDNHRVHVGADTTAADMAYTAWRTDMTAGRDALLLAPTNSVVDELNARARRDRLADAGITRIGREAILSDGLAASAGDIIKTRKNSRWLNIGPRDFVRNGYRYRIERIRADGSLVVTHLGSTKRLTLPADYVADNVTLGYASTVDLAQGLTAGFACHIVGAAAMTRQLLYVALTRGRAENHIYLSTAEQDPHRILSTKVSRPETAVEALSAALARDGAQISATTADRQAHDPFTRLGPAADMYYDAVITYTEHRLGAAALARLEEGVAAVRADVVECPAWLALRGKLATMALGRGVEETLRIYTEQLHRRELGTAQLVAAVMHFRMEGVDPSPPGPLSWLPPIPDALRADPAVGRYLQDRHDLVTELADQIRAEAATWTVSTAPTWAKAIHAANGGLATDIAVYRAAHNVPETDTRLTGPRAIAVRSVKAQNLLEQRAVTEIGRQAPELAQFNELVDTLNPRIRADSYWPQLAARLVQAAKIRGDLPALLTQATQGAPLPDELPAAALWWRIAPALSPTALDTTHSHLRPPWMSDLHQVFGSAAAEAITSDMAWPALVSAIAAVDPGQWTPRDLLHLAAEHITDAETDSDAHHRIGLGEYARLITYSIDYITRTPHEHDAHVPDPEHPPEAFYPQIAAAHAARAEAAGGPQNVLSHAAVDTYLAGLRAQDDATLAAKRDALSDLRADLSAAEAETARAYADAETRTAEHITDNIDLLHTELRVLNTTTNFDRGRPLALTDANLTALTDDTRAVLTTLAALPFTVAPVRALPSRTTTAAMRALHHAATAQDRKVLWCSPTPEAADTARGGDLADTTATIDHTHQQITDGAWTLPAGALVVIDEAAAAQPAVLADIIDAAHAARAGVILLDTSTHAWPPQPSTALMHLLRTDIPWAQTLDAAAVYDHDRTARVVLTQGPLGARVAPDLDPVLAQAEHVQPHLLDETTRAAIARRHQLREANRNTHKRHQDITRLQRTARIAGPEQTRDLTRDAD